MPGRGTPSRVASASAGLATRPGSSSHPTPLALEVLAVVERIPRGKVMSYGDITEMVGRGAPRGVGMVMAQHGHEVCWWRVVQASGAPTRSAPADALRHLVADGTPMLPVRADSEPRVDMSAARWDGR